MYEFFIKNNTSTIGQAIQNNSLTDSLDPEVKAFFKECGGYSFINGLYRTHTSNSSLHWAIIIGDYFAGNKGKIIPFGYDWMGRQFAITTEENGFILMFDPSTAEYFKLQQNITSFHNQDLVYERESILSEQLFNETLGMLTLDKINYNDCIGHKIPLFLGGQDSTSNYEVTDMEVHWEILRQIYFQIKDLPPGSKANSVKFNPKP